MKANTDPIHKVTLLDLSVLLYHLGLASRHAEVGYNDADESLLQVLGRLNVRVNLPQSTLEALLYASNLLDENQSFKHPMGVSFNEWVKRLVGKEMKFHPFYNTLEKK